jgi:endonuclease G, mitochondrial
MDVTKPSQNVSFPVKTWGTTMQVPQHIADAARARVAAASQNIQEAAKQIENGTPLRAESDPERAVRRVCAVTGVSRRIAEEIVNYQDPGRLGLRGPALGKAEAIQGRTVDYVGAAWLDAGRLASAAVGRIVFRNGQAQGTGFLVSERLLLTNNHVIADADMAREMLVEFAYEVPLGGRAVEPVRFAFDPAAFFETDEKDDLDFTLIALGAPLGNGRALEDFGACPLSGSSAKHSVGEPVNIVQHPDGDYKQVVVRENRILHRGDTVLHYVADTEPGASGSPVFNDEWQVVALHHWGGPHREISAGGRRLRTDVNEGIRVSAIVDELDRRRPRLTANQQRLLDDALNAPAAGDFGTRLIHAPFEGPQQVLRADQGRGYLRAFERAPYIGSAPEAAEGAPANRIDRNYSNRRGYNERFLRNFPIALPGLSADQRRLAARVRSVGEEPSPLELKYQHFSVVLNAERRLPFYSICNIDGAKRIRVDRDTGQATSLPEASESWAIDPRVPDEAQLSDAFYARLRRDLRIPRDFFARGHMTRREDPNWGRGDLAERANDDTFHHPNGCPQVNNAFNSSQKAWQGIENFVLNNTDDANLRVTVITGPVFRDDDPVYEDDEFGAVLLPRRFWKIVARVEDERRLVFAVLADQSEVMDLMIAAGREAREALFDWPRQLSREFISTVQEVAELTGLDFGNLAAHDVFAGESLANGRRRLVRSPEMLMNPQRYSEATKRNGDLTVVGGVPRVEGYPPAAQRTEETYSEMSFAPVASR